MGEARPARRLPLVGPVRPASVADAARRGVLALLQAGVPTTEIADAVLAWHAEALELRRQETPLAGALACQAGCVHCCHLKVTATPIEVLRLAAALRGRLDDAGLVALRASLDETFAVTGRKTSAERARLARPCVLLDGDGRCMAYEARPLSCRGANSFDRAGCAASLGETPGPIPPHDPVQLGLASALAEGTTYATMESRRDPRILELVAALRIALADERAAARWARGEPVFQQAVDFEFIEAASGAGS